MMGHTLPRQQPGHTSPVGVTVSGSSEDIRLYCGIGDTRWNGQPIDVGGYGCVSPISGRTERTKQENRVFVPDGTRVIQDRGAFSDSWTQRLTFGEALDRQIAHSLKYDYAGQISHRASYDLLIDEVWSEGNRTKRRWTVAAAEAAVDETVAAAEWLNARRNGQPLVLSAQGVDAPQYLRCTRRLVPLLRDGDLFGMGGWCIIGKMSARMMTVFRQAVALVIPFIAAEGIRRVHIWGVIYPRALAVLYSTCHEHGIVVSTDSMGPSLNPVNGEWGYGSWRNNRYVRPDDDERLGADRVRHVRLTRAWLNSFSTSIDYIAVKCDIDRRSVTRPCLNCGREIVTRRQHARTCSARCRKAISRRGE